MTQKCTQLKLQQVVFHFQFHLFHMPHGFVHYCIVDSLDKVYMELPVWQVLNTFSRCMKSHCQMLLVLEC